MNITVTGASGFFGRHLLPALHCAYGSQVTGISSNDYDLTEPGAVRAMFRDLRPDILVHLAAYVGGIGANRDYPADFFYRNILLSSLLFEGAARYGVRKLIYPMGGCSYPASAASPISEHEIWNGYPQHESAPYSIAKKTGLVASRAYRDQYGLNSIVIIPGNMYGEYDNFDLNGSHVIPGMIRRFYEAKHSGASEVVVWGTGAVLRDFVYAGDVAGAVQYFIEKYDSVEPVNISTGTATSISELAETIARLTEFTGRIVFDHSKPDGQRAKIFDTTRMRSLGLSCPTSLNDGLQRTIHWFAKNYQSRGDGIRLSGKSFV